MSEPVTSVVQMLSNVGYRPHPAPIKVASVPFDFAALLLGSSRSLDLVVVIDTLVEPETRIRQKVEGLSRALDLVASRRPLTVVLVGPPPHAVTLEALGKVSRVLTIGTPTGNSAERVLKDGLAVLLPLDLPRAADIVIDPMAEVRRQIHTESDELESFASLFEAAPRGADAVKEALRSIIAEPLSAASEDGIHEPIT